MNKQIDLIGESYKNYLTMTEPTFMGKNISLPEYIHWIKTDDKFSQKWGITIGTSNLDLTTRRGMVTQEMFNQIYNGGGPETLSHSEINQWNIPTKLTTINYNGQTQEIYE
jgi:hypothetical protein